MGAKVGITHSHLRSEPASNPHYRKAAARAPAGLQCGQDGGGRSLPNHRGLRFRAEGGEVIAAGAAVTVAVEQVPLDIGEPE